MKPRSKVCSLVVLAVAVFALTIPAQSTIDLFGLGCPGSGKGPSNTLCTLNTTNPNSAKRTMPNEYGYPVKAPVPFMVVGFQLYVGGVSGQAVTKTALYLEDAATPGQPAFNPVSTGQMPVGPAMGFYTTILDKPVLVKKDQMFWLGQQDTTTVYACDLSTGAAAPSSIYWRRPNYLNNAWVTTATLKYPAYKIILAGTGPDKGVPYLHGTDYPALGKPFTVNLNYAFGPSPAVLFFGSSKTSWMGIPLPFDLGVLGAPGCSLLASGTLISSITTTATGSAAMKFMVPPSPLMLGGTFHYQWFILDLGANTLGVTSSNGGTGVVQP